MTLLMRHPVYIEEDKFNLLGCVKFCSNDPSKCLNFEEMLTFNSI